MRPSKILGWILLVFCAFNIGILELNLLGILLNDDPKLGGIFIMTFVSGILGALAVFGP